MLNEKQKDILLSLLREGEPYLICEDEVQVAVKGLRVLLCKGQKYRIFILLPFGDNGTDIYFHEEWYFSPYRAYSQFLYEVIYAQQIVEGLEEWKREEEGCPFLYLRQGCEACYTLIGDCVSRKGKFLDGIDWILNERKFLNLAQIKDMLKELKAETVKASQDEIVVAKNGKLYEARRHKKGVWSAHIDDVVFYHLGGSNREARELAFFELYYNFLKEGRKND